MKVIDAGTTYQDKPAEMKLYYFDSELVRIEIYQDDKLVLRV